MATSQARETRSKQERTSQASTGMSFMEAQLLNILLTCTIWRVKWKAMKNSRKDLENCFTECEEQGAESGQYDVEVPVFQNGNHNNRCSPCSTIIGEFNKTYM